MTALHGLAEAQAALGERVVIVATFTRGQDTALASGLRDTGIKVRLVGPTLDRKINWHPGIEKALREACVTRPDAIHIHGLWEEIQHQAGRVARALNIPYIIRPCGMLDPWSLSQGRLHKRLYRRLRLNKLIRGAAAMHFTTDIERDLAQPTCAGIPSIVEPNGINLSEFADPLPHGEFRARHPEIQQKPLVLFLSRIHSKKGLDLLIPAFARLKTTDAQLVIAGPDHDGYQREIETLAERAGVHDRVHFLGMLIGRVKIAALTDADLLVLPSRQENFANVVIEALAVGTPVVISDQVNLAPVIKSARVGAVVPLDLTAIAAELDRWLIDDSLRQEASARGRAFVTAQYDWRNIAQRWSDHYRQLRKL